MELKIIVTFLIVSLFGVSYSQYYGRIRNNMNPLHNLCRDPGCSCSYTCGDLDYFIALIRALEEKDCPTPPCTNNGSDLNEENLIIKLVNALIEITTQVLTQNNCQCPNSNNTNGGNGNNHPGGGLLDLDLLDPNKLNNILDLDLSGLHLLGIGLGGGGGSGGTGTNVPNTGNHNGNSSNSNIVDSLLRLKLLNPNEPNNVLDLDAVKQSVLGVALGASPTGNNNGGTNTSNNVLPTGGLLG